MLLIKPSVIIESATPNAEQVIEAAGRTCYKSGPRADNNSAGLFIERLKASKHESVLEHASFTARFVCDRGVSHELVRHRLASFSQESTRYCNYGKEKFGGEISVVDLATGFKYDMTKAADQLKYDIWMEAMVDAERHYLRMLDANATPQEARSVLPNSLKTELVMTANMRQWRHVFKERTSKFAHPQMVEVMQQLKIEAALTWPFLFADLV